MVSPLGLLVFVLDEALTSGEGVTVSPQGRVSAAHARPCGWLPDGRFVFVRRSAAQPRRSAQSEVSDATVIGRSRSERSVRAAERQLWSSTITDQ